MDISALSASPFYLPLHLEIDTQTLQQHVSLQSKPTPFYPSLLKIQTATRTAHVYITEMIAHPPNILLSHHLPQSFSPPCQSQRSNRPESLRDSPCLGNSCAHSIGSLPPGIPERFQHGLLQRTQVPAINAITCYFKSPTRWGAVNIRATADLSLRRRGEPIQ
jgi:hypothetical protein